MTTEQKLLRILFGDDILDYARQDEIESLIEWKETIRRCEHCIDIMCKRIKTRKIKTINQNR